MTLHCIQYQKQEKILNKVTLLLALGSDLAEKLEKLDIS